MHYEMMLPHHIRSAIADDLPVVLPIGVLEYHGEQMGVGMDTLAVTGCLQRLEAERDLVILPPFHYAAASHAVAAPEGTGTVHVDAAHLVPVAEAIFHGLLRVGFRNIHGLVHHQSENFGQGMPSDLAFRLGARQAVFRFLEERRGEGWWGAEAGRDYYEAHAEGRDPFNWVRIHPLMGEEVTARYPFDHAGQGETSLMLALHPEIVEMSRNDENEGWFTETAVDASAALGEEGVGMILARLRRILFAA